MRAFAGILLCLAGGAGCSNPTSGSSENVNVVAAFYPLAWAAERIGGRHVRVTDLTPLGGEAHDLSITARQRVAVQDATLVLLLGRGFQPEIERAAGDASGKVVDLLDGQDLLPTKEKGLGADPHVWLDPAAMEKIAARIGQELGAVDPARRRAYSAAASQLRASLKMLDDAFRSGLKGCELRRIATTHQAFDYLAKRYGMTQIALTGQTPEAAPSAASIQAVRDAVARGEIGAMFYEATEEGRRTGESVARDAGLPALPLHTLESDPAPHDYESQMRQNLGRLRRGLRCR